MEVQILGAHSTETLNGKLPALLIDEILALDAGSLCSGLSLSAQQKLRAVMLTHHHYDHVRDIPMVAMNAAYHTTLNIYSTPSVLEVLSSHLLDGTMYPNFREWPALQPAVNLVAIEEYERTNIEGYSVTAIPVPHSVPTVGFQVTSPEGKTLFYTGDATVGLSECWKHTAPHLFITELSMPRRMGQWAREHSHLSPQLLEIELLKFRELKGYIPRTILIHISPYHEEEIATEIAEVSRELNASITLGREGMRVTI